MYYGIGGIFGNYPYLIIMLVTVAIGALAQFWINAQYKRYNSVPNQTGVSGAEGAATILAANGVSDVNIEMIGGNLTDHFDPRSEVLRLSQNVYEGRSIASVAVGAHEAGHALQYASGYGPMKIRAALVPGANIGSQIAPFLIILGIVLQFSGLVWLGIILYAAAVLFQFVTLPVELNASARALAQLQEQGIVTEAQIPQARAVLAAAAWTYVAAALVAVIYLLYYIGLARRD